ncbi:MAG: MarC family protein [Candidatus Methanofastidiosia archaeon]
MILALVKSTVALFVIMDSFGNIPVYLHLTNKMNKRRRKRTLYEATVFASFILLLFLFGGRFIFYYLQINLEHIMVAGGMLLVLVGLDMMFGQEKLHPPADVSIVPLGMPLMAGPGSIATLLLISATNGIVISVVALFLVVGMQTIVYLSSSKIMRFTGKNGLKVLANIAALVTASFGTEMFLKGIGNIF